MFKQALLPIDVLLPEILRYKMNRSQARHDTSYVSENIPRQEAARAPPGRNKARHSFISSRGHDRTSSFNLVFKQRLAHPSAWLELFGRGALLSCFFVGVLRVCLARAYRR
jgi:hypothetical protein